MLWVNYVRDDSPFRIYENLYDAIIGLSIQTHAQFELLGTSVRRVYYE
jgi:hypothetical protein